MLPAVAATAIAAYTRPGELVIDPMCGIGTTLVEAAHQGRQAIGIEYEPRWAQLAQANLTLAASQGATGTGQVHIGDARALLELLDPALHGTAALVLTSPPYGQSVHGQVSARPGQGIAKHDDRYSADPANLGRSRHPVLLDALQEILGGCRELLRPGGMLVLTARPWRHRGLLIDFPGQLTRAADAAGLVAYERNVALLVGLRDDRLVPRPSFFQLDHIRKARARGIPLRIIAHEDVLVFRRPQPRPLPRSGEHTRPLRPTRRDPMRDSSRQNAPDPGAGSRYRPTPAAPGGGGERPAPATTGREVPRWPPAHPPGPQPQPPTPPAPAAELGDPLAQLPEVLKVGEVAAILRVGRNQLYAAVARGELPAVRIGRTIRIPKAALTDLLTTPPHQQASAVPQ
jgi:excisionase family DNA binding protein